MAELGIFKKPKGAFFENTICTTKIGGSPIWISSPPDEKLYKCQECQSLKLLVLQLFTPVGAIHRLVYVFLCISDDCLNSPSSFSAFSFSVHETKVDESDCKRDESIFGFASSMESQKFKAFKLTNLEEPGDDVDTMTEAEGAELIEEKMKLEEGAKYEESTRALCEFVKFTERMKLYPEQVFRYDFGGKPLRVKKVNKQDYGVCSSCHSDLVFEFQLMPFLFRTLEKDRILAQTSKDLEWATLMVFACKNECVEGEYVKLRCIAQKADD